MRNDLRIEPVRGNVDTRLRKLGEGQFDALVLAVAGLRRLGLSNHIAQIFTPDESCPAPGQGALALQTRHDDRAATICSALNEPMTAAAVRAERAVLSRLGGGCELPIAAYAATVDNRLHLIAGVFSPSGRDAIRTSARGRMDEAEALGYQVAEELISRGAHSLLSGVEHA